MKRVIHIPPDDEFIRRFGVEAFNKRWHIPKGYTYFDDVCFEDGSPVIFKDAVLRVGKRKWSRISNEA